MILQAPYFMLKHRGAKGCQKGAKTFGAGNLWHVCPPEKSQKGAKSLGAKSAVFLVYITNIYSLYTLFALLARGSALRFFESCPTNLDALTYCFFVFFVDMPGAKSAKGILTYLGAKTLGGSVWIGILFF